FCYVELARLATPPNLHGVLGCRRRPGSVFPVFLSGVRPSSVEVFAFYFVWTPEQSCQPFHFS
ncbi:unnamed protein product, partial [Amoebophrya sp. A120]